MSKQSSTTYAAGLMPGEAIYSNVKGHCVFLGWTKAGRVRYRRADGEVVSGHGWWFFPG